MNLNGYAQELTSASGDLVNPGRLAGSADEITSASAQFIIERAGLQPFPKQDGGREERLLDDIAGMMHRPRSTEFDAWMLRRIANVLAVANGKRKWWFLENVAATTLAAGADVIDLRGHLDRIGAVYAPKRLNMLSLQELTELRMAAQAGNQPNAGEPTHYAIEAGKRVHLWPAPSVATAFGVLYTRPMALDLVPDEWETILLEGVLGRYARHYDRDSLVQDPTDFEARFNRAISSPPPAHWDIERVRRWNDVLPAGATLTAQSSVNSATAYVVPASLTGLGYVSIEAGDYSLTVN